jgi:glutaconate CoA-transferase subunit B
MTSPGFGDGAGWRERVGLVRGGPAAVITTLGVFRFDPDTREMYLASYHPGQSVDSVKAATGWDLRVAADVGATPTPTGEELAIVRACDPDGFWTR